MYCVLVVVCHLRCVVRCALFAIRRLLYVVHCALFVARCLRLRCLMCVALCVVC